MSGPQIFRNAPPHFAKEVANLASFVAGKLPNYSIVLIATRQLSGGAELTCASNVDPIRLAALLREYATSIEVASGQSPAS